MEKKQYRQAAVERAMKHKNRCCADVDETMSTRARWRSHSCQTSLATLDVPPSIYAELRDTSISSFLRFIAARYKSAPVKTGLNAIKVPESEPCAKLQQCPGTPRASRHRNNDALRAFCAGSRCKACHRGSKAGGGATSRKQATNWQRRKFHRVRFTKSSWDAGIRTPISRSRVHFAPSIKLPKST